MATRSAASTTSPSAWSRRRPAARAGITSTFRVSQGAVPPHRLVRAAQSRPRSRRAGRQAHRLHGHRRPRGRHRHPLLDGGPVHPRGIRGDAARATACRAAWTRPGTSSRTTSCGPATRAPSRRSSALQIPPLQGRAESDGERRGVGGRAGRVRYDAPRHDPARLACCRMRVRPPLKGEGNEQRGGRHGR